MDDKSITQIPRTPPFVRGVLNLRGHALPVMDLRLKFGMSKTEMDVNTCVIVTEVKAGDEIIELGALADAVSEVVELLPDQIDPPPRMGTAVGVEFITGMGKIGGQFVIVLNVNCIFSEEELSAIAVSNEALPNDDTERAVLGMGA